MPKIKRYDLAHFLNTGNTSTPTWSRINKGVTSLAIDYSAEVTSEQYIGDKSASISIDSYAPSSSVDMIAYQGDAVFAFVDNLRKKRATGAECETELLNVNIYESNNSYWAEKQPVLIEITSFGGEDNVSIGYTIHFNGDPVEGTVTIQDGVPTFSPAE